MACVMEEWDRIVLMALHALEYRRKKAHPAGWASSLV
jgi:hypothetical protein